MRSLFVVLLLTRHSSVNIRIDVNIYAFTQYGLLMSKIGKETPSDGLQTETSKGNHRLYAELNI